jgi:hypothetical protein
MDLGWGGKPVGLNTKTTRKDYMRIKDKWWKELYWTIRENLYEIVMIGGMVVLLIAIIYAWKYETNL